jgi:hypothetical protein
MVGDGVRIIDTHDMRVYLPAPSWAEAEVMVHRWVLLVGLALGWLLVPAVISAQAAQTRTSGDQSPDLADVVERLARTGQLSHTADGQSPEARAKAHGYDPCLIAENIASQHNPAGFPTEALAEGFVQGWQHSPDHRKHLLDPAVTETGVGVAQREQTGAYYAVQLFGRPTSQRIEFQLTNTSDVAIQYTIDGQTMSLPPQATRTHQPCRPAEVTFHWPDRQKWTTMHPNHGDHCTIVRGDAREFRLKPR